MERQNNKIQIDEDAKKVIGIDFSKERSIFEKTLKIMTHFKWKNETEKTERGTQK